MTMPQVLSASSPRHRELGEIQPRMAKAVLPKGENDQRRLLGGAIQRALSLAGWTADRLSREVSRDHRQVGRWISGEERAQLDTLWAVEEFRQPLCIALAELAECEVRTVIEIPHRRIGGAR
jgi:hypothetical protein